MMKKFLILTAFLMLFSINSFAQSWCGCNGERGARIAGRVSDAWGLGAPNQTVVATAYDNGGFYEILYTTTDSNGYFSYEWKSTYPPYNQGLQTCMNYIVHVANIAVTPSNLYTGTNQTTISSPTCEDVESLQFTYNYGSESALESLFDF